MREKTVFFATARQKLEGWMGKNLTISILNDEFLRMTVETRVQEGFVGLTPPNSARKPVDRSKNYWKTAKR